MNPRVHIASALLIIVSGLIAGCAMFDLNKDGKIDPIAYLQDANIQVAWTDAEGNVYQMNPVEMGAQVVFNWIEAKTKYRFELAEQQDGSIGIKVTDPKGYTVWLVPATIAPQE